MITRCMSSQEIGRLETMAVGNGCEKIVQEMSLPLLYRPVTSLLIRGGVVFLMIFWTFSGFEHWSLAQFPVVVYRVNLDF